jgi:O-antigen/teichoic acid export membrane protein
MEMEKLRLSNVRKLIISQEGFLLVATVTGYGFAYVYLLLMGRILGPVDFGVLGALFAVFYVAALVGQALREGIATKIAEVNARKGEAVSVGIFLKLSIKLAVLSLLPCLGFIIASRPVAAFFHVSSVWPVIIMAFSIFTALALDIVLGLLQGLQKFKALGITGYTVSQGLKVVLGLAFVWAGWSLLGAVGALVASTAIAIMVGLAMAKKQFAASIRNPVNNSLNLAPVLWPTLILAIFLSIPASVDVMLVTHFFGGTEAGIYNAVSTVGKVVFYLPMAVTMILLPRATERHTLGNESRSILFQSLGITLILSGIVAVICWTFPEFIIMLFFGEEYLGAVPLVGLYAAAMLIFSINIVLIHYSLAVRNFWLMFLADVITLAEVAGICLLHQSLNGIVWILFYGNLGISLFSFPYLALRKPVHRLEGVSIR